MRLPTWLWLRIHARHGTGPMKRQKDARELARDGTAQGPVMRVTWYRCECRAVRTISREPI